MHEGLMFKYNVCQSIVDFIDNNSNIKNDLFAFEACVE